MSIIDYSVLSQFNVLYLEDDENLLKQTTDILEDFVRKIYPVKTSKEALEVILNNKVDVIISDILLKDENGIDFLKYLKNEKNIHIPTILTTAHTDTQYLLDAIKLKVENYIVKPINIRELLKTLHNVLLPLAQEAEIIKQNNMIKLISLVTDGKQIDVIKYIMDNLDKDNIFEASYTEIMEEINISKPTLIKLFKTLASQNALVKVQHKKYRLNEQLLSNSI